MTEERKIQIPVVVDSSGSKAGFEEVKQGARDMAQAVAQAGAQASKGVDGIGVSAQKTSEKADAATRKFEASIKKAMELNQALTAGPRGSAGFIETRAVQSGADVAALKPMLDQLRAIEAAQKGATTAVIAGSAGISALGLSAKQTTAALRGVPAQFTDIITSLQAGQNPVNVLLQQGGQLKDMFGGIGPAARALGGYILGLVNPFTIGAAAIGGLGYAANQGGKELRDFQNAATLTGNSVGLSASGFSQLRDSLVGIAGTRGKAAEVLTEIAANGIIAGTAIKSIAEAAILMEKATGQATSKTIGQFAELARSPAEASAKLNEQYNFLTAAVYRQIKALEEQGRAVDAANLAESTYAGALKQRSQAVIDNAGLIEKAWRGVIGVAKGAWDTMLGIGRDLSPSERAAKAAADVARIRAQLAAVGAFGETGGGAATGGASASRKAALEQQLAAAREALTFAQRAAQNEQDITREKAEQNRLQQLGIDFSKQGDAFLSTQQKKERELAKARIEGQELVNAGIITQSDLTKRLQDINKKFEDKSSISAAAAGKRAAERAAEQLAKATLGFDIETIRADGERLVGVYAESERALEAMRATGLVSEQEYYDGRRALIAADSEAREGALQAEIARVQKEAEDKKLAGEDLKNNQTRVVKLQSDLAEQRSKSVLKQAELSDKEKQAIDKVKRAYEDAAAAAASYISTISRNAAREDMGVGIGSKSREEMAGRFAIDDKFLAEQQRLDRDLRNRTLSPEQYEDYLKLARFTYAQEVKAYEERTAKMKAASLDWANGAREALANYADEAANISKQTESAVGNAFQGMEDALVSFATTGKLSFKDLANSIIADIARMVIKSQITGPLAGYLNFALSGLGGASSFAGLGGGAGNYNFGGGFAKGGVFETPGLSAYSNTVVNKPTVFAFAKGVGLMGEAGEEAIMPLRRGPDGRLGVEAGGGRGGNTYHFHNDFTVGDVATISTVRSEMDANNRRLMGALDRRDRYGRG